VLELTEYEREIFSGANTLGNTTIITPAPMTTEDKSRILTMLADLRKTTQSLADKVQSIIDDLQRNAYHKP
jgi:hypothetical protein